MFTHILLIISVQVPYLLIVIKGLPVGFDSTTQAHLYLSQYGYLSRPSFRSGGLIDVNTWEKAISDFQDFAGLEITGELDDETLRLMTSPRCGVRDHIGTDERSKRYALQGSRWKVKNLSYRISKYPKTNKLTRQQVDEDIAKAFNVWSMHTDLNFTAKVKNPVHIEIRFEEGEHGDGDPFDGRGGTLAHAYFPIYGGDAHFDDEELWSVNSKVGTNLFQVAAHEFGHSLGLSHSDVKTALMAPFYRGYIPNFRLDPDDIQAIQALYDKKTVTSLVSSTTTATPVNGISNPAFDEWCQNPRMDTIFNTQSGNVYAFVGDSYYRILEHSIAPGYPRKISKGWPGLESDIDAAFTYRNGKTYFFKDSRYWRYSGRNMDGDYPKKISSGFPGIPSNIDAALVWGGNGKIYFSKGSLFWRFDPHKRKPVLPIYPKPLSMWKGLPDKLTGAIQYQGYTYFFKEDKYYRFNDRTFSIDEANPAFPRPIAYWWFGCTNTPSTFERTELAEDGDDERENTNDLLDDSSNQGRKSSNSATSMSLAIQNRITIVSCILLSVPYF